VKDLINKITPGDVVTVFAQIEGPDSALFNDQPGDQTGTVQHIEHDVPVQGWALGGVRITFSDGSKALLKANSLCTWHSLTPAPSNVEDDDTVESPTPLVEKELAQ